MLKSIIKLSHCSQNDLPVSSWFITCVMKGRAILCHSRQYDFPVSSQVITRVAMVSSIPMIATAISNSIRVKPECLVTIMPRSNPTATGEACTWRSPAP